MSRVKIIFPVSELEVTEELDLFQEITSQDISDTLEKGIRKIYGNSLKYKKDALKVDQKGDSFVAYDELRQPFTQTCFDLYLHGKKILYFFLREYEDAEPTRSGL